MDRLTCAVGALHAARARVMVGIDGPDAAGKTTLADRLAGQVPGAVRLSVDDFLTAPAVRYARGELSPEGCYRDSFDLAALVDGRLRPFAAGAPRTGDVAVPPEAVLVVDGVFLHRPGLRTWWDLSVYLHVPEAETLRRAVVRDVARLGSSREVERRYRARYLPAQELYRREADPVAAADVVVDNTDPSAPVVRSWRGSRP